jgi:hypothetical protein
MDPMKNKPLPIYIGIFLIGIISLVWWLTNSSDQSDSPSTQNSQITTDDKNLGNNDSQKTDPSLEAEPVPTFVDNSPLQKEFTQKINSLVDATKKCQNDVEILFPVDSLDGPSKTYKNFPKFKDAIQKFYKVVEQRVEKSHELMTFLETLPDGEVSPERLFAQLSSIEDCGEFEEEAILDQAMTTALELNWPSDQKRELTNLVLGLFEKQLQGNLGLHQLSSKIEVMHSLLDDGFISSNFNQDLTSLDQVMEGAENEFRQALPLDFTQKKLPSQKDIVEIKNAEREAIEKVKPQILDLINLIKNRN